MSVFSPSTIQGIGVLFLQTLNYHFFAGHPWIRNYNDIKVPLDILIFRLMKSYMRSTPLRKAALRVCICLNDEILALSIISRLYISSSHYPFILLFVNQNAYIILLLYFWEWEVSVKDVYCHLMVCTYLGKTRKKYSVAFFLTWTTQLIYLFRPPTVICSRTD